MPSNVFRFDESWELPNATVGEVYDVLAQGLPHWWKGVYLEAHKLSDNREQSATGFVPAPAAPCRMSSTSS
jgi:hypothetical protein